MGWKESVPPLDWQVGEGNWKDYRKWNVMVSGLGGAWGRSTEPGGSDSEAGLSWNTWLGNLHLNWVHSSRMDKSQWQFEWGLVFTVKSNTGGGVGCLTTQTQGQDPIVTSRQRPQPCKWWTLPATPIPTSYRNRKVSLARLFPLFFLCKEGFIYFVYFQHLLFLLIYSFIYLPKRAPKVATHQIFGLVFWPVIVSLSMPTQPSPAVSSQNTYFK